MGFCNFITPKKHQKLVNLIKIGFLWAAKNLWGYGRKVHAKFWPWWMPWDPSYDHFCVLCQRSNCKIPLIGAPCTSFKGGRVLPFKEAVFKATTRASEQRHS